MLSRTVAVIGFLCLTVLSVGCNKPGPAAMQRLIKDVAEGRTAPDNVEILVSWKRQGSCDDTWIVGLHGQVGGAVFLKPMPGVDGEASRRLRLNRNQFDELLSAIQKLPASEQHVNGMRQEDEEMTVIVCGKLPSHDTFCYAAFKAPLMAEAEKVRELIVALAASGIALDQDDEVSFIVNGWNFTYDYSSDVYPRMCRIKTDSSTKVLTDWALTHRFGRPGLPGNWTPQIIEELKSRGVEVPEEPKVAPR